MKRQADVYITNDPRDQHLLEDGGDDTEPVRAAGWPGNPHVQPALNRLLSCAVAMPEQAPHPPPTKEQLANRVYAQQLKAND